jgi:uncharacterized protein involved in outer membrane biogenesis
VAPLNAYIPAVQELAAARLGQPVQISGMRYALFPSPHLTLERVVIGRQREIQADSLVVRIGPFALLSEQKDIESIEATTVSVDERALPGVLAWFKPQTGAQPLKFSKVRLQGVKLGLESVAVPPFNADVTLTREGALQRATLSDGKARVTIAPKDRALEVSLDARDWQLPVGPGLGFDDITIAAIVDGQKANVTRIEASVGRGTFQGAARLSWSGAVRVEGDLRLTNGELSQLMPAFTRSFSATGSVNANLTYTLLGDTFAGGSRTPASKPPSTSTRACSRTSTSCAQCSRRRVTGYAAARPGAARRCVRRAAGAT